MQEKTEISTEKAVEKDESRLLLNRFLGRWRQLLQKSGKEKENKGKGDGGPQERRVPVVTDKIILKHDSEVSVEETSILRSERKQAFGSYVK